MRRLGIFCVIVEIVALALAELSCVRKQEPKDGDISEYKKMGLVEIAVIAGDNRVSTGEFIRNMLKTNGINCVVEGSLEHSVRVRDSDSNRAIRLLLQSRSLARQAVTINKTTHQ